MILVTLGTQDKPFTRLLDALVRLKTVHHLEDVIVVQAGFTPYSSDVIEIKDYYSQIELDQLRKKADLIITHAGVGSILDCLKLNKKVIGVARLEKYGEHANDHQYELLDAFSEAGYILRCDDLDDLYNVILSVRSFNPQPYPFDNSKVLKTVFDAITK